MALHDLPSSTDDRLQSALQRVSEADQRLLQSADAAGHKARSTLSEAAIAIGLGAVILMLIGGATGRRRLASSLLGLAVPVVAGVATRWLSQERRIEDRREAELRWEGEGGAPAAVRTTVPPVG